MTGRVPGPGGPAPQEPASDPVLAVEDLAFGWPDQPDLLQGLRLTVERGAFYGVIGPNGAGKSTLVGLCCGLQRPRRGAVRLLGRPVLSYGRRALARRVALVPQDSGAPFPFTVEQVVLMGRTPHLGPLSLEGPGDVALARDAMEAVGVDHLARRPLDRLSGGERQRVLIARALAQDTPLMVLDEPTAHLDIRHQVQVYDLLWRRTRERGLTVVTVLHDLNLAAAYCDRLLLLDGGRSAAEGSVAEVLTYRNVTEVYRTEVWVGVNELTGARYLVPVAGHRSGGEG